MSWGCKRENYPHGCGWASRATYPLLGWQEWWCDTCERSGDVMAATEPCASVSPEQTPSPEPASPHSGDQCTVGEGT